MPKRDSSSSRRRVRLALLLALLVALIASSIALQARWLGQLADAQRAEARRLLGAAVERMAREVQEDLARFVTALESDPADAETGFAGWAAEVLELGPGDAPDVDAPCLHVGPAPDGTRRRIVLDPARLGATLFPERVRSAFGADALERLHVRVVPTNGNGPALYDSAREAPPASPPDASAPLFLEENRWVSFFSDGNGAPAAVPAPVLVTVPGATFQPRGEAPPAPYRIEVRQRAGSLEAALQNARRRNLWIGSGLLAALGASAVLLWIGEQRARRLAEKELAFVAGVSHELRTPLAVIRVAASNLRTGVVGEAQRVREYGELIEREATRVGASVERVLRFGASEEPLRREPVELATVAREAVARMRALEDRRRFTIEVDVPAPATVLGDAAELVSALSSLLENAILYGPDGQTVRLRARVEPAECVLEVADQGPGLEPGERARVLEPFTRGSAARRGNVAGSGLGLALVVRIARAHGGRIEVGGDAHGAVFALHLPRAGGES